MTVSFADGWISDVNSHRSNWQLAGTCLGATCIASRVPTKNMADPKGLPSPVLVDSVTPRVSAPMFQTRQEIFGRPILSPGNFTPAAEEEACKIIEATQLYTNGPNGG